MRRTNWRLAVLEGLAWAVLSIICALLFALISIYLEG